MSSNRYDSESEGEDFNPAPQIDSDDERDTRRHRDDSEEVQSPIQAHRDSPPARRSSVSRDDDADDAASTHSQGGADRDRTRKARDDDDDEEEDEEEDEEDDEDDMPVCALFSLEDAAMLRLAWQSSYFYVPLRFNLPFCMQSLVLFEIIKTRRANMSYVRSNAAASGGRRMRVVPSSISRPRSKMRMKTSRMRRRMLR